MSNKFNPANAERLHSRERRQWNNPEELVAAAGVSAGDRVAEIGCGSGWFTFELEKAARPRGMVYALDMQPAMLQILSSRRENWERILTLPCGENTFELDDNEVDVVFHANVLHECEDPLKHLQEANRVLKKGGRFVNIDWRKIEDKDKKNLPGPPNQERMDPAKVHELFEQAGFEVQSQDECGPYHYITHATKK